MHEQITNLGWAWHGYCDCPGEKGKLYKKAHYKLKHFEKKHSWELKNLNTRQRTYGTDDNLIESIKNI